ncbi:integrase [Mycobacterium gordonae]|uniref:Integrase n=1 Tax=Mycobacterium gordonae TaxID=1778 RepID=A0A0Q2UD19_MYCGO|nr:hypothetical protein [Mycobacterium gordonae]KQH78456.1 integrase [Mycobacterium gordonae]
MTWPENDDARSSSLPLVSDLFDHSEDVFSSRPDRIDNAPAICFGASEWDAFGVIPKPPNRRRSHMKVVFPEHPAWSLRSREVAMALLNTRDPRLLNRSVSFGSRQFSLGHVRSRCESYRYAAKWQADNNLPDDISMWTPRDWSGMVKAAIAKGLKHGTVNNHVNAIRDLVTLSPILTGGGIASDPWNGQTNRVITRAASKGRTEVIPPARWIPLISACWTYIDVFADDILTLRDTHRCELRVGLDEELRFAADDAEFRAHIINYEAMMDDFLESANAVVPMRSVRGRADQVNWVRLSRLITAGLSVKLFSSNDRRRNLIDDAIAAKEVTCKRLPKAEFELLMAARQGDAAMPQGVAARRKPRYYDAVLEDWLGRGDSRVAVFDIEVDPTDLNEGDINWKRTERVVFGNDDGQRNILNSNQEIGRRRKQKILEFARSGHVFDASRGYLSNPRDCVGFTRVDSSDHGSRPWRDQMSDYEARCELRALRAACYVFIAAMTMMRDSEIQDLKRDCMRSSFGVLAVKSNIYKGRSSKKPAHWWIVDEVAATIRILERLSVHPEYLFGSFVDGDHEKADPGITASSEIDWLLTHLAATGGRSSLPSIPGGPNLSPRMFRRTTACISRDLGGNELALSHQLKHVIDYSYANSTSRYMAPDPAWAALLKSNSSADNVEHMVNMIKESAQTSHPLAGRGGERLTQVLNDVLDVDSAAGFRAILMSDTEIAALLKKIAPEIHFGPANACLYDEDVALCRRHANPEVRGPILGLCQPARCSNSVVGVEHLPVWISELQMLKQTIAGTRLSPPRRQALSDRQADVERVLDQAHKRIEDVP